MEIKFEDITDQQYADLIAYFTKKKLNGVVKTIVIHSGADDIVIEKKPRLVGEPFDDYGASTAACCGLVATLL